MSFYNIMGDHGVPTPTSQYTVDVEKKIIKSKVQCTLFVGDGWDIEVPSDSIIIAGNDCTIHCSYGCSITAGNDCSITAGSETTVKVEKYCDVRVDSNSTINAGENSTIKSTSCCSIYALSYSTIYCHNDSTLSLGGSCYVVLDRDSFTSHGCMINYEDDILVDTDTTVVICDYSSLGVFQTISSTVYCNITDGVTETTDLSTDNKTELLFLTKHDSEVVSKYAKNKLKEITKED